MLFPFPSNPSQNSLNHLGCDPCGKTSLFGEKIPSSQHGCWLRWNCANFCGWISPLPTKKLQQQHGRPPKTTRNSYVFFGGGFKCWQLSQQPCPLTEWNLPTFQADFLVPIKPSGLSFVVGKLPLLPSFRNQIYNPGCRKRVKKKRLHPQRQSRCRHLPTVKMAVSHFSHKKDCYGREVMKQK